MGSVSLREPKDIRVRIGNFSGGDRVGKNFSGGDRVGATAPGFSSEYSEVRDGHVG